MYGVQSGTDQSEPFDEIFQLTLTVLVTAIDALRHFETG